MSTKALNESFVKALNSARKKPGRQLSHEAVKAYGKRMPPSSKAEELAESWKNGNKKHVIEELDKLRPKTYAFATLYYLVDYLGKGDSSYDQNVLGRMLGDRV